ncbi:MAG TPA: 3-hydroxyacyl-CoA dehydrogenase NAD-binding domain-containing protein [Steroidobacter sp.]|nr:3-hydroxyacyl-CoA dehydrogenase NAD-binding domain-containing protein [Steroidobacter sp.]
MKTLRLDVDADGIALITLDAADKPMNVVSPQFIDDMIATIERVAGDAAIKGAIITSGKPAFMAGADLKYILGIAGGALTLKQAYAFSQKPSVQMHRRMETCGKPFVAAINGLALGGGYELALACHHRVIVDDPKVVVGLPEVTVGLLPGSGGTQRLARMVGVEKAAALLLDGRQVSPAEALQLGMVDQVVPAAQLLSAAREWLLKSPNAVRAWDVKGYRGSNGLLNPAIVKVMSQRPAQLAASTRRNYPAPIAILDSLFQGTLLPFDKALQVESKHFARLLCDPVARNLIRTSFVNRGEATKLARRPQDVAKSKVTRVGVLGAGMMGSGIAYVSALAGIDVVLLDSTQEQAEQGKQYSVKLLAKAVERGKQTRDAADATLARIKPTTDYAALAGCELVVEAVFEDVVIKAEVTKRAEAVLAGSATFASNTSTLPITKLAEASSRPAQFIGLHFFSPVDRMPLVEVILGKGISQETLAKSLDFIAQLRMTPIVVNDSRGFYTSRVFQTFIHEGMRMLEEGIEPARIENAANAAGFPVGPLALLDEVTIELPWKIVQEAEAALGANYVRPCAYDVMRRMLYEIKRPGRRAGGGFYEYPADAPKRLWPGLSAAFPPARRQPDLDEVRDRLLYIQAIETARCLEEGVLTHPADADIGALLGWGFPAWTGGPLSFIETVGLERFVENAERMTAKYGSRFAPSDWLRARAEQGENFYQAVVPHTAAA